MIEELWIAEVNGKFFDSIAITKGTISIQKNNFTLTDEKSNDEWTRTKLIEERGDLDLSKVKSFDLGNR